MSTSAALSKGSQPAASKSPGSKSPGSKNLGSDRARSNVPSVLAALLWKDASQVGAAVIAVTLILLIVQVILFIMMVNTNDSVFRGSMAQSCVMAVLGAPILIGIACGGMLVGHERQSRTWHWSTTLPVDYKTNLLSKLLVTIIAIVSTTAVLCVIPLIAWFQIADFGANWTLEEYLSVYLFEVWSAAVLSFFISALVFREPMTALFYGGAVAIVLQAVVAVVPSLLSSFGIELNAAVHEFVRVAVMLLLLLAGAVLLVRLFHWRWTQGLDQSLAVWPRSATKVSGVGVAGRSSPPAYRMNGSPSEWIGHLQQSFRMSLGVRLGLVVLAILCLMMSWDASNELFGAVLWPGLPLLFGLTAFAGDHAQNRHGFLADRGATPWKVAASRLAVPLLYACLIATAVIASLWSAVPSRQAFWSFLEPAVGVYVVCLALTLLGALASLCFKNSPVAFVVSLLTVAGAFAIYVPTQYLTSPYDPNPLWVFHYSVRLIAAICVPVLALAVFTSTHYWLVAYRPKLGARYAWVTGLLVVAPILLVIHFGFLLIPNRPWQGLTGVQHSTDTKLLPDRVEVALLPSRPPTHELLLKASNANLGNFYSDTRLIDYETMGAYNRQPEEARQQAKESLSRLTQSMQEMGTQQAQGEGLGKNSTSYQTWLNETLAETAFASGFYYEQGEAELAGRILALHGELHRQAAKAMAPATATGRATSLAVIHRMLSDEALTELEADVHLAGCTGPLPPEANDQYRKNARIVASADHAYSAGRRSEADALISDLQAPPRYWQTKPWVVAYPTLRWRYERAIALQLNRAMEVVGNQSYTNQFPYALLTNWHEEMYQGKMFRDALRPRLERIALEREESIEANEAVVD